MLDKRSMKVLVVGPHPDDQELAMGGTISLLQEAGHTVVLLDMTNGEPTPFGSPEVRLQESQAAAEILGVTREQAGFKNREVTHGLEARHRVAAIYRRIRPDLLFIPYPHDAHPDHLAVARIAEDARFDAKLTRSTIPGEPYYPPRVIYYFCTHLRFNFPAGFCMDISAKMEKKLAALKCYQSQFFTGRSAEQKGESLEYVRHVAEYFGGTIRRRYAEPFYVAEMLGLCTLDGLVV